MLSVLFMFSILHANSADAQQDNDKLPKEVRMTRQQLLDKIKGGWAGQTIGVTFGGPYEFQYCGLYIPDTVKLKWYDGYLKNTMNNIPGLYDDLYVDLTFVEVIDRLGLNAPVDSFSHAFAHAPFPLDQANQAARYNILNGIAPPASGFWMNNPHADDIDYQIEADFVGLMSPGMPNAASALSDKVGHIMNYGDGWYGGVFVGAMYSLAFITDNVQMIVQKALKTIPAQSTFHQCISDVIQWHHEYPDDWHEAWEKLEKKWASSDLCPDGSFREFDIDAKLNSAYVVLGLLYGNGDYSKSLEIATRAGQDADCNPSTVAGVLGTMLGYSKIPAYWKMGLKEVEDINFIYTNTSLNKVYRIGFDHALQMIKKYGGKVSKKRVTIAVQEPETVQYEKSFPDVYPVFKKEVFENIKDTYSFTFTGTGFVVRGVTRRNAEHAPDYTFMAELYIDGKKVETGKFPTNNTIRRRDFFWRYGLPKQEHHVKIVLKNPDEKYKLETWGYLVYADEPVDNPVIVKE